MAWKRKPGKVFKSGGGGSGSPASSGSSGSTPTPSAPERTWGADRPADDPDLDWGAPRPPSTQPDWNVPRPPATTRPDFEPDWGAGRDTPAGSMPTGFEEVADRYGELGDRFDDAADRAEDYGQNNEWAAGGRDWYANQMEGNMANNPWMSRLYDQTEGLDMDEGMAALRDYLGGGSGGSGGGSGGGGGGGHYPTSGGYYNYGGGGSSSSGGRGGGNIPDSTAGDGFFKEKIQALFDAARLDPANDPTIKPMIDSIKGESEEAYWRAVTDLTNKAEGAGRYGSGLYQGMRSQHADEYHEALQATMAQQYQHARDVALQQQMEGLGLVNTRDIAEGQMASNEEMASMSAAASGRAAQLSYDAQMDGNRLQAMQMMLGAGQFGMQMGGEMAGLMQSGQENASKIGQGWAQIGQEGFNQAGQFGQLGLGAAGGLADIYKSGAELGENQYQFDAQRGDQQQMWMGDRSDRSYEFDRQMDSRDYEFDAGLNSQQQMWMGDREDRNYNFDATRGDNQYMYSTGRGDDNYEYDTGRQDNIYQWETLREDQQRQMEAANRLRQQQMAEDQRRWNDGAAARDMNELIRMMTGLNELGGYDDSEGYMPGSAGPSPDGMGWEDIMGAILGGYGASNNFDRQGG